MFHEMVDSTWTSAEMPLQTRTHHSPAKSWAITHGVVGVADIQHAVLNQIHDLFIEGCLETIANVTRQFLVELDRLLSDRGVKRDCSFNCFGRRLRSANDFDERNDVR